MHGFLHENSHPQINLPLGLFWDIRVKFEPVEFDGERWDTSLGIGWLTWPVENWQDLSQMDLAKVINPDMVETSIYFVAEHWRVGLRSLSLSMTGGNRFLLEYAVEGDIDMGSATARLIADGQCEIDFTGIIVVPGNHPVKPDTPEKACAMVSGFMETENLAEPVFDRFRYVFKPIAE